MHKKTVIKVLIMSFFSVLVLSAWSCASGKSTRSETGEAATHRDRPENPASAGSALLSQDLTGSEIILRGQVFITGTEPNVSTMFASSDKNYTVFPKSVALELAGYQGYTIEISGLLLDSPKAVSGLLPSDGVIAPRQWKIVQE